MNDVLSCIRVKRRNDQKKKKKKVKTEWSVIPYER